MFALVELSAHWYLSGIVIHKQLWLILVILKTNKCTKKKDELRTFLRD